MQVRARGRRREREKERASEKELVRELQTDELISFARLRNHWNSLYVNESKARLFNTFLI